MTDFIKDPIKGACCKEARKCIYWSYVGNYWYIHIASFASYRITFCPFCGTRLL